MSSSPAAGDDLSVSPLSMPIHRPELTADSPPWRDNAFLLFWDPEHGIFGSAHVSTSPNAQGRRARFSLVVAGETVDIVEPLEPYSFTSASIDFDVEASRVQVSAPQVQADLTLTSRFVHADYAEDGIFPSVHPDHPVRHYQQDLEVTGTVRLREKTRRVTGHGLRDRTWGFRDESASMKEYAALVASFPDHALTVVRMLDAGGGDKVEGYRMSARGAERVTGFGLTRDASGFLVSAHVAGPDGEVDIEVSARRTGFWVPMGAQRRGPSIRAYDEFTALREPDGVEGFGVAEQAIVHQLY